MRSHRPLGGRPGARDRAPAAQVGVRFEPGLVSKVVADVHHQPGRCRSSSTLTELFASRTSDLLTNESYRATGGVVGALGRRAEALRATRSVGEEGRAAGLPAPRDGRPPGTGHAPPRARRELRRLEVEPAVLDEILARYGEHGLLTFDREPLTQPDRGGRPRGTPRPVGAPALVGGRAAGGPAPPSPARGGSPGVGGIGPRGGLPAPRGAPGAVRELGGRHRHRDHRG